MFSRKLSTKENIVIGIGLPTKSKEEVKISMIIFQPDKPRMMYSKQQLHSDELPYFTCGSEHVLIQVKNVKIGIGICYETLLPEHSENLKKLGADILIASVAKSQNGLNKASKYYPEVCKSHAIPILMANSIGQCDDFLSVGKSSVWNKQGESIAHLDSVNEGLLIFDFEAEKCFKNSLLTTIANSI